MVRIGQDLIKLFSNKTVANKTVAKANQPPKNTITKPLAQDRISRLPILETFRNPWQIKGQRITKPSEPPNSNLISVPQPANKLPENIISLVKQTLENRIGAGGGFKFESINSFKNTVFSDSSLGVRDPNMNYTQAQIKGYTIEATTSHFDEATGKTVYQKQLINVSEDGLNAKIVPPDLRIH